MYSCGIRLDFYPNKSKYDRSFVTSSAHESKLCICNEMLSICINDMSDQEFDKDTACLFFQRIVEGDVDGAFWHFKESTEFVTWILEILDPKETDIPLPDDNIPSLQDMLNRIITETRYFEEIGRENNG